MMTLSVTTAKRPPAHIYRTPICLSFLHISASHVNTAAYWLSRTIPLAGYTRCRERFAISQESDFLLISYFLIAHGDFRHDDHLYFMMWMNEARAAKVVPSTLFSKDERRRLLSRSAILAPDVTMHSVRCSSHSDDDHQPSLMLPLSSAPLPVTPGH